MSRVVVQHIKKRFGSVVALADVTFALEGSNVLAVVGANGAGKSTLLNCLAGTHRVDGGTIEKPEGKIGYLGHQSFLYSDLSVEENLVFWARIAGTENAREVANARIESAGLLGRREDKVGTLSAGMQKRVSLCRAMVNRPELLLLDEPYSAFDEAGRQFLRQIISDVREGGGIVIMATHNIEEAIKDCSHFAVLDKGRIESMEGAQGIDLAALAKRLSGGQR